MLLLGICRGFWWSLQCIPWIRTKTFNILTKDAHRLHLLEIQERTRVTQNSARTHQQRLWGRGAEKQAPRHVPHHVPRHVPRHFPRRIAHRNDFCGFSGTPRNTPGTTPWNHWTGHCVSFLGTDLIRGLWKANAGAMVPRVGTWRSSVSLASAKKIKLSHPTA